MRLSLALLVLTSAALAEDWGTSFHDPHNTSTSRSVIRPPLELTETIDLSEYWRGGIVNMSHVPSFADAPIVDIKYSNGRIGFVSQNQGFYGLIGVYDCVLHSLVPLFASRTDGPLAMAHGKLGVSLFDQCFAIWDMDGPLLFTGGGNGGGCFNADDHSIYVSTRANDIGSTELARLDVQPDGTLARIWSAPAASTGIEGWATPLILEDRIILSGLGTIGAIAKSNGRTLWKQWCTPGVWNTRGPITCPGDTPRLSAYYYRTYEEATAYAPVFVDGHIYARAHYGFQNANAYGADWSRWDPVLVKLDPETGAVLDEWPLDHEAEKYTHYKAQTHSALRQLLIHDNLAVFAYNLSTGSLLRAYDLDTHAIAWERPIGRAFLNQVQCAGDVVYTFDATSLLGLDVRSGEIVWSQPLPNMVTRILLADGKLFALASPLVYVFAPKGVPADMDRDGDVDLADFLAFGGCFGGPNRPPQQADCEAADFDGDADVDISDFRVLLRCMNGPNRPPNCE